MDLVPDLDNRYRQSCTEFTQSLVDAISASNAIKGIRTTTHTRRFWASVLLSRMCLFATSALKLAPGTVANRNGKIWDFSSIATLSRSIFECYLALIYLCIDSISDEEYELRLLLFELHDCTARIKMLGKLGAEYEHDGFVQQIADLQVEIGKNKYFLKFESVKQRELLKGKNAYYLSQDEIVYRVGRDKLFARGIYEFLSAHVHSFPISYYRTPAQPGRGTGRENVVEKEYTTFVLSYTAELLEGVAIEIKTVFPEVTNFPRCRVNWDNGECTPLSSSNRVMGSR